MPQFNSREELDFALNHQDQDSQIYLKGLFPARPENKWKILAEGDSWFKYPKRFFGFGGKSNIIQCLSEDSHLFIESDAENGDEIIEIFAGEKKNRILKKVRDAYKRNNYYDILLLSGGGNDIVGVYDFDWFIKENPGGDQATDFIRSQNLSKKIQRIEDCYSEIIERVLEQDSDIRIISHEYDYAIPDPTGFRLFDWLPLGDSWIHPFLTKKNITNRELQIEIVKTIFGAFIDMQARLADKYSHRYTIIKTAGTLSSNQWRNEIHPTPEGFAAISQKFIPVIKSKPPRP